jgi:hypothetical protein
VETTTRGACINSLVGWVLEGCRAGPEAGVPGGRYGAAPALYELAVDAKKYGAYSDAPGAPRRATG